MADDASTVILSIVDNDDPPTITFALSATSVVEGSSDSVTLTATPSAVSSQEITLTYIISENSTADPSEYTVLEETLVIPANAASGSITISSEDDTEIELLETIIFTFIAPENATIEDGNETVTLNVESDDDPIVVSVTASPIEFGEHEFTTIEATISAPASRDVIISLDFAGTATIDVDYLSGFDSEGEESLIGELPSGNFSRYSTLLDGRHVFLNTSELIIWDSNLESSNTIDLSTSYYYMQTAVSYTHLTLPTIYSV